MVDGTCALCGRVGMYLVRSAEGEEDIICGSHTQFEDELFWGSLEFDANGSINKHGDTCAIDLECGFADGCGVWCGSGHGNGEGDGDLDCETNGGGQGRGDGRADGYGHCDDGSEG